MRVFYITCVLGDSGGSEIYVRDIIREMAAKGHDVCVATTEPFLFDERNVEVFLIPVFGHHALHKFIAPFFYRKIVKKAVEFNPDIVQTHSNSLMGWIGDKVKEKLSVPHILLIEMISANNTNIHTKTIHAIEKFLLPKLKYDRVIVWTKNMKKKFLLLWGIKNKRIVVIPAALNAKNYPQTFNGKNIRKKYGKKIISSIKTLWSTNVVGLTYIIKAMKYVKEKHPEYRYLCAGQGNPGALQNLAEKEGVGDVVIFPGSLSDAEKKEVWAATDISPHSFVYEFSTSISLLEYMAMGKACIITNVGAAKEFARDSALLVEPENPKAMAEGIIRLIEDSKLRNRLGKKARKLFLENYSIKSTVISLEKVYALVLGQ